MNFFYLWLIGLVIAIVIGLLIRCQYDYTRENFRWLWLIPIIPSVVLAGGIPSGLLIHVIISSLQKYKLTTEVILVIVVSLFCIFCIGAIGYWILGLEEAWEAFEIRDIIVDRTSIFYVCIFILGAGIWTGIWPGTLNNYYNNIEKVEETIIIREERQLISFCNIPVQEISGSISGSSVLGTGSIKGNISTSNELPYWYMNENGEGEYDSAIADNSKIIFFNDNQKPYIEIIVYRNQSKTINHNNGKEDIYVKSETVEYIFHLPEEVMEYGF